MGGVFGRLPVRFPGRFLLLRLVLLQISLLLPGCFLKLLLLLLSCLLGFLRRLVSVRRDTLGLRVDGQRPRDIQDRQQDENGHSFHPESLNACAGRVLVRQTIWFRWSEFKQERTTAEPSENLRLSKDAIKLA